ncbi:MAG TPA: hypothetical protein VKR53_22045 [Puia sp.]|nr:hypothetical protein [Puia sp.]
MKLKMKLLIKSILFVLLVQTASAQYYYKDIVATQEAINKEKNYKENRVKSVEMISKNGNDETEEGFVCQQRVTDNYLQIDTYSKSKFNPESFQTTFYSNNGLIKRTVDTSKSFYSVTDYQFDEAGHLTNITNTSTETDNQVKDVEEHQWQYDKNGNPLQMIKIKNGTDTTYFHFVIDDKRNVAEEHGVHKNLALQPVYYYYNDDHKLTDIVRYNNAAKRLLPDYIFSYNQTGTLASMVMVPEGSNDYQRWIYDYNDKGLRMLETCLNKQKQTLGKIYYQYNFIK